ncbi:MAG: histidine kinase [Actinomycetota bacterium]
MDRLDTRDRRDVPGPEARRDDMTEQAAGRLVRGLWIAAASLWSATVVMIAIDRPPEVIPTILLGLPIATYVAVGGLIARRRPENPIGWLFCAVALSFVLLRFGFAYAQAGLGGDPGLGSFPGAAAVGWIGVLSVMVVLPMALPWFLLVFPDGHLLSRRWRVPLAAALLGGALILVGATADVASFDGTMRLAPPGWLVRIPGIGGSVGAGATLAALAAFAGLAAMILRFRSSSSVARQPLRLLVGVIASMGITTAAVVPIILGSGGADWSWLAFVLAFLVDGFGVLIGIPLATAAAVLTYGLYDVGIVVKKTVVYVVLVIFFLMLLGFVSLILSPLAFMGNSGVDARGGSAVARIVAMGAVFLVVLILSFRPIQRLARRVVFGRRATPYEAMTEFSERMGEAYATDDVLPRMAEIVRASTGADVTRIWLLLGGELRPIAAAPSGALELAAITLEGDALPEIEGVRAFPVRHLGDLLGALTLTMPAAEPLSKTSEQLVSDLASQAGLVLRNVRLIQELQESRLRIVSAQDERARILERNIHDGAQQQLVALSVKLGLAERLAASDPAKVAPLLADLKLEATDALENLRDLARGIYPPLLADKGLPSALTAQTRRSPIPVSVAADGVGRLPQAVEAAVYFCCLEALQNVAKYANASSVTVSLERGNSRLTFAVTDDGDGFDVAGARSGTGLQGMEDRLSALGGRLDVRSEVGHGSTVTGNVPITEERGA